MKKSKQSDVLAIFYPGFSDIENQRCECGDLFSEHEKPPTGTSWDICSFPCLKCKCQEFATTASPAAPKEEAETLVTGKNRLRE